MANIKKKIFNTKQIAIIALLVAMMIIFAFVPINIAGASIAVLPLIAIFIACQAEGGKVGFFMGFAFGLLSLISAIAIPQLLSPVFYNPMVSIVPRIFIGITTYFSYIGLRKGFRRVFKNKDKKVATRINILLSSSISSAVGTITNTALVIGMIYAFNAGKAYGGIVIDAAFLSALVGVNFVIEIAIAMILTPPIVLAIRVAMHMPEIEDMYDENGRPIDIDEIKGRVLDESETDGEAEEAAMHGKEKSIESTSNATETVNDDDK
ncbi:MAG: ECF transporter S component [Eubacteriales bacterium]|nr:ECF transporter S component [Eubacteriales bacterium]